MQTHPVSIVVMDVGAFKVGRSTSCDRDAAALRAGRARGSVPLGRWKKVQGQFKMHAHRTSSSVVMDIAAFKVSHCPNLNSDATALRAARMRSSSIGEERQQKVQRACTHLLRRKS